jgi:uncharacterized membrane protein
MRRWSVIFMASMICAITSFASGWLRSHADPRYTGIISIASPMFTFICLLPQLRQRKEIKFSDGVVVALSMLTPVLATLGWHTGCSTDSTSQGCKYSSSFIFIGHFLYGGMFLLMGWFLSRKLVIGQK